MVSDRSNGIYRGVIAALIGLILVSAASPVQKEVDGEKDTTQEQIANAVQGVALAINDSNKPDQATQPCQKGKDNRNSDLCAQWKAADAAKQSADSADKSVTISWIGLALGGVTMIAAIAAAIFAERAAFHTKSSQVAYRAREKARLLPSVGIDGAYVDAIVKNVGPTQAVIHLFNSSIYPEKPLGKIKFLFVGQGSMDAIAVEGGGKHRIGRHEFPLDWPKAYFIGAIIYSNIFNDAELLPCFVEIDRMTSTITPHYDGDWVEWERELEKFRRRSGM